MSRFIECCCDGLEAAREAWKGGADRIELCADLPVGGVTPGREIIRQAIAESAGKPVNVLIRPRSGDFVYSDAEIEQMKADIAFCAECGVASVVIGALKADGNIDLRNMLRLMSAVPAEMGVTFHRAFDECADPFKALEQIIFLGCTRLLTSGHEPDAYKGRETVARLVSQAAGRLTVMPGCGINPFNIVEIEASTGAVEFHSSAKGPEGRTSSITVEELKNRI